MQHDNIVIAEGGLPTCAQVRAVEHERERTTALVLRERAAPVPPACCGSSGNRGVSLPAALAATPPLKEVPGLPAMIEPGKKIELPVPTEQKTEELFPEGSQANAKTAASKMPTGTETTGTPAASTPAVSTPAASPPATSSTSAVSTPILSVPTASTPATGTSAASLPNLPRPRESEFGTVRLPPLPTLPTAPPASMPPAPSSNP